MKSDARLAGSGLQSDPVDLLLDGREATLGAVGSLWFRAGKRGFDIIVVLAALPVVLGVTALLIALNPLANRGPVFFMQRRMGRDCRPFTVIKFRSMRPETPVRRGPDDPLEDGRITPLGRILRRTRLDELPQFLNVLWGDMSLIGPRPDYWDHAIHYADSVPGYRQRHRVRPGITGLAQVQAGYAEGIAATLEKTRADLTYIERFGLAMDLYVLWRTISVVVSGYGAR
ncbi:MAG: sugar transferase [Paracoccaceae bacterium]